MLKVGCKNENQILKPSYGNESNEVTSLIIDKKESTSLILSNGDVANKTPEDGPSMGHKGHYKRVLLKNNVTQDLRTQSLPNCLVDDKEKFHDDVDTVDSCDIHNKLLVESGSPPQSPWFKTWPERCDKVKSNENATHSSQNTQIKLRNCDIVENAYSPVTKQLHLVETNNEEKNCNVIVEDTSDKLPEHTSTEKKGHKRNQAGSFSSTVSSLSEPSPSRSLLDADEKSLTSLDDSGDQAGKKGLSNFFSRNVFSSWKSGSGTNASSTVWKLFSKTAKNSSSSSPLHGVVSSTALIQHPRPSNLPAKTQEEEQRHREEYKAMVAAARKKEAQNTAARQKLQKLQLQQEEHQATAAKHFIKHVLPNWEQMYMNKKTRDLWWQGLPSSVRGKVWRLAIGNELNLTPQLYEICLSRAQNRLNSPEPSHCENHIDQESSMDVIQLDISRTFPHLCIFQEGGPYSDILHSLLAAYVCYRPDVGYVQGMSYIAAILILNMDPFDAFICFANLLNQPLHLSAFTLNQEQMEAYYSAYNEVFSYNLPKLYAHFEEAKLTPDLYLLDWIYTIFAKAMPLDVACRVWDIFLRDGFEFIFRTALGILHLNQDILITMDFLHGAQFLTRLPDDLSSDQLFRSIQAVTTSIGKQSFCQIVEKYSLSVR
ncbi:TBC1 domain family member 12-like isoform X2 [Tribolium madens]|uniref:TBC1 domain family member 12-like isoform X2 n=1 Tax=Tribolium madens TaxID=41895 RepID=UPI001CF76640|nr:TBC1 domain family member 12-like isoform X2 [Tribolium madens]